MMRSQLSFAFGIMIATAAPAADVLVEKFSSNGGCGQAPSFDVIETSPLNPSTNLKGESLRVFFNDFFLQTNTYGTTSKNCVLDASVRIPAGFRFRPVSASAEGSYNLQPKGQSQGFISVSYEVQPEGWEASSNNEGAPFTGQGDINCIAKLDQEFILGCSKEDTVVNLHTNIDLRIQQSSNVFSQMDIDAARQDHDLSWKWDLYSCSSFFEDRDFQTNYVAYNGQSIPAIVRFTGSTGTFRTSSFSGTFNDVTYAKRGYRVQGQWSASGSRGTFVFDLVNEGSGEFRGTWKDGNNPKQGGTWNGRFQ